MNAFQQTTKDGAIGMTKRKPLPTTIYECRDCGRKVGWCKDVKDPKGARCYDCSAKYRNGGKQR